MTTIKQIQKEEFVEIENVFMESCMNNSFGIAYPRCEEKGELLAELNLYEQSIEESCFKLEIKNKIVGAYIFLYDDEWNTTYLGLGFNQVISKENYKNIISEIEKLHSHKNEISCSPLKENENLTNALEENNWINKSQSLEMKFNLADALDFKNSIGKIKELNSESEKSTKEIIANLLGSTQAWNIDFVKGLNDLLKDEYQVTYLEVEKIIVSVIVWIKIKDTNFSRIEYISTDENQRKKGYAKILLNEINKRCKDLKDKNIFLSTSPDKTNVIKFYENVGFEKSVESLNYVLKIKE